MISIVLGTHLLSSGKKERSTLQPKTDSLYYVLPTFSPTVSTFRLPPSPKTVYYGKEVNIPDGSYEVEACRNDRCYTLEADIYDGVVETIYFPNGGYLDLDIKLDENGYGYDTDYYGNEWEIDASEHIEEWVDYFDDY